MQDRGTYFQADPIANEAKISWVVVGLVAIVGFVARNGFSTYPGVGAMMIWGSDFPELPSLAAESQYNMFSVLPYALLGKLGFSSQMVVVCSAVGLGIVLFVLLRASRHVCYRTDLLVFVASPAFLVVSQWLGSYDIGTLALLVAALYVRRRFTLACIGVLAAMFNFEQFVIAFGLLVFVTLTKTDFRKFFQAVMSGTLAFLGWSLFLASKGVRSGRGFALRHLLEEGRFELKPLGIYFAIITSTMLLPAGLVVAWIHVVRPTRLQIVRTVLALLAVVGFALLTLDHTRVGGILALPISIYLARQVSGSLSPRAFTIFGSLILVVGMFGPAFYVWDFKIHVLGKYSFFL